MEAGSGMEYIGIMIPQSLYKGIPLGRTNHEMLSFYEKAGAQFDLIPCYFRLQDIQPGQKKVLAYVRNRHGYRRKWVSAPKVIHNRAIYKKPANQQKIEELIRGGTVIYNQQNRYDKLEIYEILMRNESLRPHLPCTVLANQASLEQMMDM